jgi:hypothetical protein
MTPMCDVDTGEMVGWAIGSSDCENVISIGYYDTDGVFVDDALPTGWKPCVQGVTGPAWSPGMDILTSSETITIDFGGAYYQVLVLEDDAEFTGINYTSPGSVTVLIVDGGSGQTITFNSDWTWVSAVPEVLTFGESAILHLISTDGTAEGVFAEWRTGA